MRDHTQLSQKTALRFTKTGPAIYHSHHDMMRFWERALKRAEMPMRLTQGFNPHIRIVFPHALGLGIASLHEEIELELHEPMPLAEILRRMRIAVGDTLEVQDAFNLTPSKKGRQLLASSYDLVNWPDSAASSLTQIAADILARKEIMVERGAPGKARILDIRPYIADLVWDGNASRLKLELRHTTAGSARPDEIARLAAERAGVDAAVLAIVKTGMRLE